MKYTQHFTTNFHDVDALRHLRPSSLLRYMQESANLHCSSLGLTPDRLRDDMKIAFVLSRIAIKINCPVRYYEDIDAITWTCPTKGYVINRCFEVKRGDTVVAQAASTWALIDLNTHRPDKYENHNLPFSDEEMIDPEVPLRFHLPDFEKAELAGSRKIMYSDIDFNMHMNNTHYPDLFCDYIPDMEKKFATEISLSFVHEAHFGADIDIYRIVDENDPDVYYLRICEGGSDPKNGWIDARIKAVRL